MKGVDGEWARRTFWVLISASPTMTHFHHSILLSFCRLTRSLRKKQAEQEVDPAVGGTVVGEEFVGRSTDGEVELLWSWKEGWGRSVMNLVPEDDAKGPQWAARKRASSLDQLAQRTLSAADPVGHLYWLF